MHSVDLNLNLTLSSVMLSSTRVFLNLWSARNVNVQFQLTLEPLHNYRQRLLKLIEPCTAFYFLYENMAVATVTRIKLLVKLLLRLLRVYYMVPVIIKKLAVVPAVQLICAKNVDLVFQKLKLEYLVERYIRAK